MAKVRSKDTTPEIIVRKLLFNTGYRYLLHRKNLPGSPDIVFVSRKKVIFVHGCFWHRHAACKKTTIPTTRTEFWQSKFAANIKRDAKNTRLLKNLGWEVLVVWECEVKNINTLKNTIFTFLNR